MNVFGKISLPVTKHGVSPMIWPLNDRVQSEWGKTLQNQRNCDLKNREWRLFFDAEGVIHREFVPEGQKANAEFYVGVLDRLLKRIWRVRTAKFQSSEWLLLHDNAPSHNTAIVKKFLANRNLAVLHYPPYSPDLAPADYFLFPKLKFSLKGRHFQTVEEIQCAVTRELNNISKTAFLEGMKNLKECVNKYNHVHITSYLCFITVV